MLNVTITLDATIDADGHLYLNGDSAVVISSGSGQLEVGPSPPGVVVTGGFGVDDTVSGGGFAYKGVGTTAVDFVVGSGGFAVDSSGAGPISISTAGGQITISAGGVSGKILIGLSSSDKIGFFGVAQVAPQVSGGTLPGVIAGLVALGLFSS